MAFPPEITPATIGELLRRKELYSLEAGPHRHGKVARDVLGLPRDMLKINSYQLFIQGLINPRTPYRKIHLSWAPGIGKTVGALVAATEFIKVYKQLYASETMVRARFRAGRAAADMADVRTPSVFVLGFAATETAFVRDLIGYSYFGFVSAAEREELTFRQTAAAGGSESDVKALHEYESRLRRRLTDKSRGGFYKFLGYEKFVNRLFSSTGVDFVALERETQERMKAGEPDITLQDVIDEYIAAGKVAVNEELLARLENSLLICDEIHDTYNKSMKNNRGVAIQYVLNRVKSLRFISMSATPVNNSPAEIVDFANYFIDNRADQLKRRELFDGRKLRPGALERIGAIMFGKVSFVQDTDTRYFPTSEIVGEELVLPQAIGSWRAGDVLPYLRFLKAPMTPLQLTALNDYMSGVRAADDTDEDEAETGGFPLSADGFTVYDTVFPIPQHPGVSFRSSTIRPAITESTAAWKREAGVAVIQTGNVTVFGGDWLRRENIAKYSSKYALLLDDLEVLYKNGPSKCLIYHFRVEMAGAVFIAEMLKANGYIDETANPTGGTRCVHCGKRMSEHGEEEHSFAPIRYIVAHHSAPNLRASIEKFRAADNADGSQYAILIGSEIIKQSYDFKCVQTEYILSLSTSIRILLQILGRVVRKDSHALLPPHLRHVKIKILLQVREDGIASPEVLRYAAKMEDHLTVQQIMRVLNAGAADANIDRAINMSPALLREYFPNGMGTEAKPRIDTLYYTPVSDMPRGLPDSGTSVTYYAHDHYRRDMQDISALVKWAFMKRNVWTRDELYSEICKVDNSIGVEVDPRTFTRPLFAVVMQYLTTRQQMQSRRPDAGRDVASIYDYVSKYVYVNGVRSVIVVVSDYYIAIPIGGSLTEDPPIDAETFLRLPPSRAGVAISMESVANSIDRSYSTAVGLWESAEEDNDFLTVMTGEMQVAILRKIIEGESIARSDVILRILRGLGALVTRKQVDLFKDVAAIWAGDGKTAPTSDGTPEDIVGYTEASAIWLYAPRGWISVKRTMMNRSVEYREASGYVGVLETVGTTTKLKIRKSIEDIRGRVRDGKGIIDTRLIDRGMNCETKSRQQLEDILLTIGGKLPDKLRIRSMCSMIRDKLISLESAERSRKTKTKYLYGWWDEAVNVKLAI